MFQKHPDKNPDMKPGTEAYTKFMAEKAEWEKLLETEHESTTVQQKPEAPIGKWQAAPSNYVYQDPSPSPSPQPSPPPSPVFFDKPGREKPYISKKARRMAKLCRCDAITLGGKREQCTKLTTGRFCKRHRYWLSRKGTLTASQFN